MLKVEAELMRDGTNLRVDVHGHVYRHVHRHEYRHAYRHVCRHAYRHAELKVESVWEDDGTGARPGQHAQVHTTQV